MNAHLALARLACQQWRLYALSMLLILLASVSILLVPKMLGNVAASIDSSDVGASLDTLWPSIALLGVLLVVQGVLASIFTYTSMVASERIAFSLRRRFFEALLRRPLDSLTSHERSVSRLISDVSVIQAGLSTNLTVSLRNSLLFVGALCAIAVIDITMALVCVACMGINAWIMWALYGRVTAGGLHVQELRSRYTSVFTEASSGLFAIQAFAAQDFFLGRFTASLSVANRAVGRNLRLMALATPVAQVAFTLSLGLIVWLGARKVVAGSISSAGLISLLAFMYIAITSAGRLNGNAGKLRRAAAVLKANPLLSDTAFAPAIGAESRHDVMARAINVVGVGFQFPGSTIPVLRDISFSVAPGTFTAIIGKSGVGKSTLASLLAGVSRPTAGFVSVGARPGAGGMVIVPQHPCVIAGTIADNIRFGQSDLTEDEVRDAAARAHLSEFTAPGKTLDYEVAEGARNLSRGQQQRIALARALARNPSVLLLDEATASLDAESEAGVLALLDAMKGRVTIVAITHSEAMANCADQVVTIELGAARVERSRRLSPTFAMEAVAG
ncbi:ABC transporter ATP-binding protein [Stenotrophomonas sp. C1657]|uniref:ABC transporter ATP-binding protein n=1 Tax=Stenotrophomonas sp. C1657 TaxID=3077844 RepID=UPI00293CFB5C|nr:ABC transporter ATP-binding protein [Stenotrophomonas sp. C1657]MDV3513558.1 ABC transporter ATP-binding protein [Stenotrophomonas sp. C1657]